MKNFHLFQVLCSEPRRFGARRSDRLDEQPVIPAKFASASRCGDPEIHPGVGAMYELTLAIAMTLKLNPVAKHDALCMFNA